MDHLVGSIALLREHVLHVLQ